MTRPPARTLAALAAVLAALGGGACGAAPAAIEHHPAAAPDPLPDPPSDLPDPPRGLHVAGNRLLDAERRPVQLRGVNRSGAEYACIQGWGFLDGPADRASVRAIARWGANTVRLMLNEHCWLGIGVDPAHGGAAYRRAVLRYVDLLHDEGIYPWLALAWAAPAGYRATYQPGAPDADHAPRAWHSIAAAFRDDPDVILAPWGETIVNADCFRDGGVCEATFGPDDTPYRTAGMQEAVDVMRAAGFRGVIAIPGLQYANDLSHWLSHRPHDPLGQLIAEAHVYGGNACADRACLERAYAPVAREVPLVLGEVGETYDASSCGAERTREILDWADEHGAGYALWTWAVWEDCHALVADDAGTPASPYGRFVAEHLTTRAGLPSPFGAARTGLSSP